MRFAACLLLVLACSAYANPAIDMPGYLSISREAREPGTIILDARSPERFREMHIQGAVNLPFPDIAIESLAATIPDRNTRILIYCNNNFTGAPGPFPAKIARASLNLSTYIALYSYGYRNIYELEPLLDIRGSRLPFVTNPASRPSRARPSPTSQSRL